eukprot:1160531-Pelagomonas_calceolata.AAC.3
MSFLTNKCAPRSLKHSLKNCNQGHAFFHKKEREVKTSGFGACITIARPQSGNCPWLANLVVTQHFYDLALESKVPQDSGPRPCVVSLYLHSIHKELKALAFSGLFPSSVLHLEPLFFQALKRLETLVVVGMAQAAQPKEHLALLNTLIDLTQELQAPREADTWPPCGLRPRSRNPIHHRAKEEKGLVGTWRVTGSTWIQNLALRMYGVPAALGPSHSPCPPLTAYSGLKGSGNRGSVHAVIEGDRLPLFTQVGPCTSSATALRRLAAVNALRAAKGHVVVKRHVGTYLSQPKVCVQERKERVACIPLYQHSRSSSGPYTFVTLLSLFACLIVAITIALIIAGVSTRGAPAGASKSKPPLVLFIRPRHKKA